MTTVSCSGWDHRNTQVLSSGERCVRESFESLTTGTFHGGFSVADPKTNIVWHYIVETLSGEVVIRVRDTGFNVLFGLSLGTSVIPREVTHAIVGDEILICSPDFPPVWGLLGSGLIFAEKQDSVNPTTTAVDIVRGICVAWGGRAVLTDGEALYFSDALYPRTFVVENIVDPPGDRIMAMHVNAGGALILVTSNGVWAIGEDAAAGGQLVVGAYSKLSDYRAHNHRCSCSINGRILGLVPQGYKYVDQATDDAASISEKVLPRTSGSRVHFENYQHTAVMFSSHKGPLISVPGFLYFVDTGAKHSSWWSTPSTAMLVGMLRDQDGTPLFVFPDRIVRPCGNVTTLESTVAAHVAGRVAMPPDTAPVLRQADVESTADTTFMMTLLGSSKSSVPDAVAPIVGTSSWGSGTYQDVPRRSRRFNWAVRSHDLAMELIISRYPAMVPQNVSVKFAGPGRDKRTP